MVIKLSALLYLVFFEFLFLAKIIVQENLVKLFLIFFLRKILAKTADEILFF